MAYCQNCGTKMEGSHCPKCGVGANQPASNTQQPNSYYGKNIRENVVVKSRYSGLSLFVGGFIGIPVLLLFLLMFTSTSTNGFGFMDYLLTIIIPCLAFLPGVISILLHTPAKEIVVTLFRFLGRTLLYIAAWAISIAGMGCLVGLFLRCWRLGVSVSKPTKKDYTVFIDGQKIGVTQLVDNQYSGNDNTHYIYADKDGNLYRPPLAS